MQLALAAFYSVVLLALLIGRRRGWHRLCCAHGAVAAIVTLPLVIDFFGGSVGWGFTFLVLLAVAVEALLFVGQLVALVVVPPEPKPEPSPQVAPLAISEAFEES